MDEAKMEDNPHRYMTSNLTKKKTFFFIVTIISLCILFVISVLCIIAQVYIHGSKERELQYVGDAFLNYRLKPDQAIYPGKGWFHVMNDHVWHINSLGLRGCETEKIPSPGTFRIAVLGGSAVFDIGVSDNNTFVHKLQEMLQRQTGKEIEVINCGVSGWSTVHSLVNYMLRIRYLKPNLILVYHTWNDIKYFSCLHDGFDLPKYFSLYGESRQRYLNGSFPLAQVDALRIMLLKAKVKLQGKSVVENGSRSFVGKKVQSEQIFDTTLFENSLTDLVRLAKQDGVSVLLSTQANLAYDDTTTEDRKRICYSYVNTDHDGLVKAIKLANDVIFHVGKKEGVPVIDVYKSMMGKSECFIDHVHLNAAGCEKIAALFSNRIVETCFSTTNDATW